MSDIEELRMLFGAAMVLIVVWIVYIHRWHLLLKRHEPKKPVNSTKRPKGKRRAKPARKSRTK